MERKNKQTEKKQANFYAVQTRSFVNIACSRVPKNLREGYGCFYHRLSIRPSPDSHSLSYWCILVCWRGTRTTLVPSNNIEACTTRSQLMARVPRSPSIANIASAQSFPRFSSQFFFFFSMFEFLGGQDSKMYRVHEQSSTSVNLYKGKHNRWSFHTDFLFFLVVISC